MTTRGKHDSIVKNRVFSANEGRSENKHNFQHEGESLLHCIAFFPTEKETFFPLESHKEG